MAGDSDDNEEPKPLLWVSLVRDSSPKTRNLESVDHVVSLRPTMSFPSAVGAVPR